MAKLNMDSLSVINSLTGSAYGTDNTRNTYQNKVNQIYGAVSPTGSTAPVVDNQTTVGAINPFLKRDGSLRNKYINYQQLLDDDGVNSQIKSWVEQATGLQRTPQVSTTSGGSTTQGNTGGVSPSGASVSPTTGEPVQTTTNSNGGYTGKAWTETGNSIVDAAGKYQGVPYVWGGNTPEDGGMDCSGFVIKVYNDAGYSIADTDAAGLQGMSSPVAKADLKPGDMVFYGSSNKATHVGIYIGNGQIIHSSGQGSVNTVNNKGKGVTISSVDYRSDYRGAGRL